MNMKRFLFITYAFPPQLSSESILITKLMKHICDSNWQATVICADSKTTLELQDNSLLNLIPKDVNIIKVPSKELKFFIRIPVHFIPFLKKIPDAKLIWYQPACQKVKKTIQNSHFDLIFSWSSYLVSHLVGLYAKKTTNLPWVAHFSDPWVDNSYTGYRKFTKFINLKMERAVMEYADAIVFVSQRTRDLVMRKYPKDFLRKTYVIPHCFDPNLYPELREKEERKFTLIQTGNFYGNRTPLPFFKALEKLVLEKPEISQDFQCYLVGNLSKEYQEMIKNQTFSKIIKVISPVSYSESLKYMKSSDVLLLIDAPSSEPSIFLPAKLIDYLGAKKPILGITSLIGESADLINNLGIGEVVDCQDIEGIKNKILLMYEKFKKNNFDYKTDNFLLEQYEAKNITKKLIDVFNIISKD